MTDQTKKVSEFSIATSVAGSDRFLLLTNPDSSPIIKTVNVATVVANVGAVGSYVNTAQLSSNLLNYVSKTGLASSVATLNCYSASFLGDINADDIASKNYVDSAVQLRVLKTELASNLTNYPTKTNLTDNLARYQTLSGLSSNVARLTANNAAYLNGLSAFDYVTVTGLGNNLANYPTKIDLTANLANYQTRAGLSANVATLTSNSTNFVGTVSAANVVSNAQLQGNLTNYQTTAGLSANVATLTANEAIYFDGHPLSHFPNTTTLAANLANYQTRAGLSANVLTMTANNSLYLGGVLASQYLTAADLDDYQRIEDLPADVLLLTSNASLYSNVATYVSGNGSVNAYSGNFTANVSANNILLDSGFGSKAPIYGVRAWGTFDGRTGVVAWWWWWWFYAITELDEGVYKLTFNTPMPDTNYAVIGNADLDRVNVWFWYIYPGPATIDVVERTTTYVTIRVIGGWWYNYLLHYSSPKVSVAVIR